MSLKQTINTKKVPCIDHGNDVTWFFVKKINIIVKNKSTTNRNDAIKCSKLAVKPLAYCSWFHLSFEHFMTSFLWSKKMRELEIPSDLKFHAELS